MAWNEPGGNSNNQDPWGDRKRGGQKQGPPDLDEALRKLQDNLKKPVWRAEETRIKKLGWWFRFSCSSACCARGHVAVHSGVLA